MRVGLIACMPGFMAITGKWHYGLVKLLSQAACSEQL